MGSDTVVVGAGLAGALLAMSLHERGYNVDVYELRDDIRKEKKEGGRSINLVLTYRGLNALRGLKIKDGTDLSKHLLKSATPVYGRVMHDVEGNTVYQPYGPDESYCNFSISRTILNQNLIDVAEDHGVRFHFQHGLDHLDLKEKKLFSHVRGGHPRLEEVRADHFFGADGAGSRCRQALKHLLKDACADKGDPLGAGYKELHMPASAEGTYAMNGDALHIWPRGTHFLMGLANLDGSFTMTLYMPMKGSISFEALETDDDIRKYFETYYPDAIPLMPDYVNEYRNNILGFLGTVYCDPWYYKDSLALLGDAAHAIVPFFGQGCNASFEDVSVLMQLLDDGAKKGLSFTDLFETYGKTRKPDGDAIAQLAIDNYYEMMDKTGDDTFLFRKEVEIRLAQEIPIYHSRYALVTHTSVPYHMCAEIGRIQRTILDDLCKGIISAHDVDMNEAKRLVKERLESYLDEQGIQASDMEHKPLSDKS